MIEKGFAVVAPQRFMFVQEPVRCTSLFESLLQSVQSSSADRHARATILVEQILCLLATRSPQVSGDPSIQEILETARRIETDPYARIRWLDVAAQAGLSWSHFRRLFRRELGLPPHAFLLRARMGQAARDLTGTPQTIKQIARRAGYEDPAHFTRVFGQIIGVPPRTLRQRAGR